MYLRVLLIVSLLCIAVGLGAVGLRVLAPAEPAPSAAAGDAAEPAPPAAPAAPRARLLVAARALPPGTLLKEEDLALRDVPADAMPSGAVLDGMRDELRGGLLRRYHEAGEPLNRAEVLRPRDRGFLAAVLRGGRRAISVGVDVVTGTAGLIWPGDQVDLILTQELAANDAPLGRRVVGETVLTDLRVIAVDQTLTQGVGTLGAGDAAVGRIARTVTLEVTAEQAERVAVASRLGRLAVTVRAMEGTAAPDVRAPPVFSSDVSTALSNGLVSERVRMRVIQGNDVQEVTFR
jgi:pilus assembly protein CpaB